MKRLRDAERKISIGITKHEALAGAKKNGAVNLAGKVVEGVTELEELEDILIQLRKQHKAKPFPSTGMRLHLGSNKL